MVSNVMICYSILDSGHGDRDDFGLHDVILPADHMEVGTIRGRWVASFYVADE